MKPTDVMARACPSLGHLGSSFYFTPQTVAAGKAVGLDGFRFYFLGRGGVLGDVESAVVTSAFGYFKPSLVDKMWTSARKIYPPRDAARLYVGCCQDHGRARLGDVAGLGGFCEAAESLVSKAMADPGGLTLFAGWAAEPLAEDLPARAMQLVAVLRELRGSAHLVAVRASGLSTPLAHRMKRPGDVATFGWEEGEVPEPTDEDQRSLELAEQLTDRLLEPVFAELGDAGATAFLSGLESVEAALA
jgi:hypothetical protein